MLRKRFQSHFFGVAVIGLTMFNGHADARNVFLNGIDISSARLQNMENVNIRIDGEGNVFILAPHYQVNEESTYVPLSSWKESPGAPKHEKPRALPFHSQKVPESQPKELNEQVGPTLGSAQQDQSQTEEKAGSKEPQKPAQQQTKEKEGESQ